MKRPPTLIQRMRKKMEAAIAELVKGKTLVVIAHKLPRNYER